MKKIAIVFGSTTDNTKNAAETIAENLAGEEVTLFDVAKLKANDLDEFPNILLGTSTWGFGDLQDDWDSHLAILKESNLDGKTIALFGTGDSSSYSETFVDGIGILYETIQGKGCKIVGQVSSDDYDFDDSKAVENGKFVGLALDEDNESSKTQGRIKQWLSEIVPLFQ